MEKESRRAARLARRADAEVRARGGRHALRRPAPDGRDRPLDARRAAAWSSSTSRPRRSASRRPRRCSQLVRRLQERGLGVILITHNLADVFQVADRIVVLRLGRNAGEYDGQRPTTARRSSPRSPASPTARPAPPRPVAPATPAAPPRRPPHEHRRPRRRRRRRAPAPRPRARRPTGVRARGVKRLAEGELGSLRVLIVLAIIWTSSQSPDSNFLTSANLTNLVLQIAAVGTDLGRRRARAAARARSTCRSARSAACARRSWPCSPSSTAGAGPGDRWPRSPSAPRSGCSRATIVTRFGDPVVRRHAGRLAGLAGRAAEGARRDRHGQPHRREDHDLANTLPGRLARGGSSRSSLIAALVGSTLATRRRRARGRARARRRCSRLVIRLGAAAIALLVAVARRQRRPRRAARAGDPRRVRGRLRLRSSPAHALRPPRATRSAATPRPRAARASRSTRVRDGRVRARSTLAAFGGILAASRLLAVNQSSGGSDLLLLAIAGPGDRRHVSLFGGRGSVWGALLGALVIGSISNGMDLLGYAVVDEVHGHRRRAAGRRGARRARAQAAVPARQGLAAVRAAARLGAPAARRRAAA